MKYRKHITQMSKKEIKYLVTACNNISTITYSKHSLQKLNDRNITKIDIESFLNNVKQENIIEFNTDTGVEKKVLLRSTKLFGSNNLCIVLDIVNSRIVTAYWNNKNYHHSNIQISTYYTKNLKIY